MPSLSCCSILAFKENMKLFFAALGLGFLTVGCGGSDGAGKDASAGAGGAGDSAGASAAGASTTGVSGSGGRTGGAGSSAAGSSSSAAGSANSGDCELDDAIVSCHLDTGQGSGVCTETAIEGTAAQVVRDQCGGTVSEGEHCPTNASLAGYCKGGVTTYYYETTPGQVWANIGASCEATSGTWCGR